MSTVVEGHVPSDADLELAAANGDREAFATLAQRHFDSVYDYLRRLVRNEQDAQDLAQETFIRAMTALRAEVAGRGTYKNFLFTIGHRLALNLIRGQKRIAARVDRDDGYDDPLYEIAETRRSSNPDEVVAMNEAIAVVRDVEAMLKVEQAELLQLYYHKGFSAMEIAGILGLTVGNVQVRLTRVRDDFRAAFVARALLLNGTCAELQGVARSFASTSSREAQRRIQKHIRSCELCQEEGRRFTRPGVALGALAVIPFPFGLRELAEESAWKAGIEGGIIAGGGAGGAAAAGAGAGAAGGGAGATAGSVAQAGMVASLTQLVGTLVTSGVIQLALGIAIIGTAGVYVAPRTDEIRSSVRELFGAGNPGGATARPSCTPIPLASFGPSSEDAAYAASVLALSNGVRAEAQQPALVLDSRLTAAAAEYARFVVETRWWASSAGSGAGIHVGADCRDHFDRATSHGYPRVLVGENVLWQTGDVSPDAAFQALLSGPHENPALPDFARTGVACFESPSAQERACVQVFAGEP